MHKTNDRIEKLEAEVKQLSAIIQSLPERQEQLRREREAAERESTFKRQAKWADERASVIARHEKDGPMIHDRGTGFWYFPDGAVLENNPDAMPREPQGVPKPGWEQLHRDAYRQTLANVRHYWMLCLKKLEQEFTAAKMRSERGSLSAEDVQHLKKLQTDVVRARKRLARAERNLNPPEPEEEVFCKWLTPERRAAAYLADAERQARRESVEQITI